MRHFEGRAIVLISSAVMLATGAAAAPHPVRPAPPGQPLFPRPTSATVGPGVSRLGGPTLGPGLTRSTSAIPGPGVVRVTGPTLGPGLTRPTGATPGPGVFRPTGPTFGPDVERPTGAAPGPGVSLPTGAEFGPDVTRPAGPTPGPGVPRAVGPTPGPNVERPLGAIPGPGVERPTGSEFGLTFRPVFVPLFLPEELIPSRQAIHAGQERGDLSTEFTASPRVLRPDLTGELPAPVRVFRPDLSTEQPAPSRVLRPDLTAEQPAPPRDERTDLSTDPRTRTLGPLPIPAPGFAPGVPAGGTFTGGSVGAPDAWRLGEEDLLGEETETGDWRLFNEAGYRAARFAIPGPMPLWGPLSQHDWTVSGQAGMSPAWSTLQSHGDWTVSGRAGYGPDWSSLGQ